jgi:hypothetical protein
VITEEDQRCIMIIGGIGIFLPSSLVEASACIACEEVMQQESMEEAMGPIGFKINSLCIVGTREYIYPVEVVMKKEIEKTFTSSQEIEEEKHSDKVLT